MIIRTLTLVGLAGVLAACTATAGGGRPAALNPTSQYSLQAEAAVEEIALAPREDGLSPAQRAALGDLALRSEGKPITVRAPAGGDPVAVRSAFNARAALEGMGVPAHLVRVGSYDAPDGRAPILVGFTGYRAVIPTCGREWNNLTATRDNSIQTNFGCAVTANMAAQIADPTDIVSPQALDPTDASRRSVVLDRYRRGETTAADTDDRSSGNVSRVVP
jgi:pilus assembly protein CpaD